MKCNLIAEQIDKCKINSVEMGELLNNYISVEENIKLKDNLLYMATPIMGNNKYVRITGICKGDKLCCADENELYEFDKKLNELGYETRVGRSMCTGDLSIAILDEPKVEGE